MNKCQQCYNDATGQDGLCDLCRQRKGAFPVPHYAYQTCQHDFYEEIVAVTSDTKRKWSCRRCLEVRYTND